MNFQIGRRTFFGRTSLNQVADSLRIDRDKIEEALLWTPDEVRKWLSQYPAEVLKSRAHERLWIAWKAKQPQAPARS